MEIVAYIVISIGLFFMLTGSIGILRLPDFFSRLHASGITDSFGAPLVIFGLILLEGFTLISLKLFVAILLIYITAPTACHALAKAANSAQNSKKT